MAARRGPELPLAGRRVLITGAARGIGAALARRLHERGARVAVVGLEEDLLEQVARSSGDGPFMRCDVTSREQVEAAVAHSVDGLGGLDVVVANAGVAAQVPLVDGDVAVFEKTIAVNLMGVYYTLRAAGPHVSHPRGYALAVSSLAAAVQPPLLGAYGASKAGVEALGNTLRAELRPSGARVGVAYFAELDTDMTQRGFSTEAAKRLTSNSPLSSVAPLSVGIDALERGIERRSRRVFAPRWVGALLPIRMALGPLVERATQRGLAETLEVARAERAPLTTPQDDRERS